MTTTQTRSTARAALLALHTAHPHHVRRLEEETDEYLPGTAVRLTATYGYSDSAFYSGIKTGDTAIVTAQYATGSASIRHPEGGNTLAIHRAAEDLTALDLEDYTHTLATQAAAAAKQAAASLLERAYTYANRLSGTDDAAALQCLRDARRVRLFASAMQFYAEYLRNAAR